MLLVLSLTGGCSPGLLVGGAIAGSVLYAHVNQDDLPSRREPMRHQSGSYYANSRRATQAYMIDDQGVKPPEPKSHRQENPASLIREGAEAYRELQWDAARRALSRAINTNMCTSVQLGQAHLLMGAIAYQRGDAKEARLHFTEAQRHDGQLQPSPEVFPPPMVEFYRNATERSPDRSGR